MNIQQLIQHIQGLLQNAQKGGNSHAQSTAKPLDQNQWALNALKQNMIDQTAYTPAAKKVVQNMPTQLMQALPANAPAAVQQMRQGSMGVYGYDGSPTNAGIDINPTVFNGTMPSNMPTNVPQKYQQGYMNFARGKAIEVLRHEMGHALDSNMNNESNPAMGNSNGFAQLLSQYGNNPMAQATQQFVANYHGSPLVQNRESFAQYGSGGQNVLLSNPQIAQQYQNIYQPMSKYINYSPVFKANLPQQPIRGVPGQQTGQPIMQPNFQSGN